MSFKMRQKFNNLQFTVSQKKKLIWLLCQVTQQQFLCNTVIVKVSGERTLVLMNRCVMVLTHN